MSQPPPHPPTPPPADDIPPTAVNQKSEPPAGVVSSGLTKLGKPADAAPRIDTAKRARIDELWKDALAAGAHPSATLGSLATVQLHPDSPTQDWQQRLPRAAIAGETRADLSGKTSAAKTPLAKSPAQVVVDDPSGKVDVRHDPAAAGAAPPEGGEPDPLAGGTLDALAGGTIDTPASQHGPAAPAATGPTAADSASSANRPLSSTAPTLPGRPVDAPHPGTRMVPSGSGAGSGVRPRDFRIETKIASGGMGDVFMATQLGLQRVVALKRPKPSHSDTDARLSAFVREGTVTGDLEHPSIVPIYQNGVDADGLPYYAMKLVHGIEWRYLLHPELAQERKDAEFIQAVATKGAAMDLHEHLNVLLKVCDAVAFAHSRHILHRDLKPENVIVGDYGEVQVMDWGLAIDFRDQTPDTAKALSRTNIRGPAGTPSYMAPEMALGEVAKISPATDVYLLGAILYEILTGHAPHGGSKIDRVLYQAAVNEFVPVAHANLEAAPGLIAIVNRALATEPAERFPNVPGFQQAIREHLTHEQSLKISTKAQRDLDKLLAAQTPAGAKANGTTTGTEKESTEAAVSARYIQFAEIVAAFRQALELWPLNEPARAGLTRGLVAFVEAALNGGDLGLAHAQLEQLRTIVAGGDAAQRAQVDQLARRWTELDTARRARQRNFKLAVSAAAVLLVVVIVGGTWSYFSILAERNRVTVEKERAEDNFREAEKQRKTAEEQTAEAQKQRSRAEKARLEADQQRAAAEIAADRAQKSEAVAIAEKKEADRQRTEAETQRKIAETQRAEAEKQRGIADEQRQVAEAKTVEAEDQRSLAEANLAEAERQRAEAVKNLGAVDIQRARTLIAVHRDYPQAATFLLRAIENTEKFDPTQALRELDYVFLTSPRLMVRQDLNGAARRLLFFPGKNDSAAVLLEGGHITSVSTTETVERQEFAAQADFGAQAFAIFQKQWVVLAGPGQLQRLQGPPAAPGLWDGHSSYDRLTITGFETSKFTCLTADDAGKTLALGTADGQLLVVTAGTDGNAFIASKIVFQATAHRGAVSGVAFRGDTGEIITTGADGRLCIWKLDAKRNPIHERQAHLGFASALAVNTLGTLAATAGPDGAIKVWNLGDVSERLTLQGHLREVGSLAFSPLQPFLASQSFDGTVRLWQVGAEQLDNPCLATLHVENTRSALQVAFDPLANRLVCLDSLGLQVWDLRNWIDATPSPWQAARFRLTRLLSADGDRLQGTAENRLLRLTAADSEEAAQTVTDLAGAFTTAAPTPRLICLTHAGLIGPPDKLEPLLPRDAGAVTAWTRQNNWVLILRGGRLFLADTRPAKLQFVEIHNGDEIAGMALDHDGRFFAWTTANDLIFSAAPDPDHPEEWNDLDTTRSLRPYPQKILQAAWLPDGRGVVLRTGHAELPLVDTNGEDLGALGNHQAPVRTFALDTTGNFLASADAAGKVRLTDLRDLCGAPLGPPLATPPDQLLFDDSGHYLLALTGGQLARYRLPQADPDFDLYGLQDRVADELGYEPDDLRERSVRDPLMPEATPDMFEPPLPPDPEE